MSNFEEEFLDSYLKFGLGSLPKSDIDALVMHLLDRHGYSGSAPLGSYGNQIVSQRLKVPVSKVKKLRYEAALKFGGDVETEGKGRLLAALAHATLEADGDKINLIIEDALAKNWLQGQLKVHQQIYDHSFNSEIVKVPWSSLVKVLKEIFEDAAIDRFVEGYEQAKKKADHAKQQEYFKGVVKKFAEGAAKAAGAGVVGVLKAHVGVL